MLTGAVHSVDGTGLGSVIVQDLTHGPIGTKTSDTGAFTLPVKGRAVLLFTNPTQGTHQPKVVIVEADQSSVIAVLERESIPPRDVPVCRNATRGTLGTFTLKWPRSATCGTDVDYSNCLLEYSKSGKETWVLKGWNGGPPFAGMWQERAWKSGAVKIDVRSFRCGSSPDGLDFTAINADGSRSRWIGTYDSYLVYAGVPESVARQFDKLIGSACCR